MYKHFIHFYGWMMFLCMDILHFVYSSIDGHTGCTIFWLLWIVLLQSFVYKVLCKHMFPILLGQYVGVELLGHNFIFKHLRNCQTVFQIGYTIFYLHQQCIRDVSNFSTFSLTLVIFWLILVILYSSSISWRFWFAYLW